MSTASKIVYSYLRTKKKFPHVWCPGCGIGIVLGALLRSMADLEIDRDNVAMISVVPAGCRFIAISILCIRLMAAP